MVHVIYNDFENDYEVSVYGHTYYASTRAEAEEIKARLTEKYFGKE